MSAHTSATNPFKQPKAVWAVAFACVVSFMGIGLVDPILPALKTKLNASSSQIELLFTSYLVITAVMMLITGWVSSRIGAKRTLITGLTLIVIFAAAAGSSSSIGQIVGFRAGWGLGNSLFIATSLAVIVASASGGFAGAIILYETALGIGIAVGPLLGGELGSISWRGPFFGVAVLMLVALVATVVLLDKVPTSPKKTPLSAPIKALRHRGLATVSITGFLYNWAFFTLLGFSPLTPKLVTLSPVQLGLVFCGWGVLVALFSVIFAPRLQQRFGTGPTMYVNFGLMAIDLAVMAVWINSQTTMIVAIIVAGAFIGINNTLMTQAVMSIAPVERPVASATYGFVRFFGGGLAPFVAGKLAEHINDQIPFWIGAATLIAGMAVLSTAHKLLAAADRGEIVPDVIAAQPMPERVIVAALDATPMAIEVTDFAGELASARDTAVELVHIIETDIVEEWAIDVEDDDTAARVLEPARQRLAARGIEVRTRVLHSFGTHGARAGVLADHARRIHAQVVVVGESSDPGRVGPWKTDVAQELTREAEMQIATVTSGGGIGRRLETVSS